MDSRSIRKAKSEFDSAGIKKTGKRKRTNKDETTSSEADMQDTGPKKRQRLIEKSKFGFLGQEGYQKFTDGIPYYLPTRAYYQLVEELNNKSSTGMTNATVVPVFDMSGVGKSTLFKESAKTAGAYCFAMNCSAAGPFVSLHDAAKQLINPFFSNGSASVEDVMPKLKYVFRRAFAIMLNEIKECLTKGTTDSWCLLTQNRLHDAMKEGGPAPDFRVMLQDIAKLLNGRPALILHDEIQLFATHLTTIKTNSLPSRVYEHYKAPNEFSWKDFLIVAFYRTLFSLALDGRQHGILFCQAGTYNFENVFVHSPCKPIASIDSCLPLELFDMVKCKTVFDHFWRFNITNEEKEDLLGQLLGPPRLMEYFFVAIGEIQEPPERVTCEDLQKAVDEAVAMLEKTITRRLADVAGAYDTYVQIVLYPEDYGGKLENEYIVYPPGTQGFNILQEKGNSFAESSVLRLYRRQSTDFVVEMPSRASQLVMSHVLFATRKEQYNNLIAVLNNKGNAFETLLLLECCEATSPLFKRINFNTAPKITYTADKYIPFKNVTEVLNKTEDFIAKVEDSDGGQEQGAHKIDVVFRLENTFVAIQGVCQDFSKAATYQAKLNDKLQQAVTAFSKHVGGIKSANIVFVFASMFDFKLTKQTNTLIAKQKFRVVVLTNFDDCIFPFYLMHNKEKLTDGAKIRSLIKLYYQRMTGKPAQSVDFEGALQRLVQLQLDGNFFQKLVAILTDKQHTKQARLTSLLTGHGSMEELKGTLEKEFGQSVEL